MKKKHTKSLTTIHQGPRESIQDYLTHFVTEATNMEGPFDEAVRIVLASGLWENTKLK